MRVKDNLKRLTGDVENEEGTFKAKLVEFTEMAQKVVDELGKQLEMVKVHNNEFLAFFSEPKDSDPKEAFSLLLHFFEDLIQAKEANEKDKLLEEKRRKKQVLEFAIWLIFRKWMQRNQRREMLKEQNHKKK